MKLKATKVTDRKWGHIIKMKSSTKWVLQSTKDIKEVGCKEDSGDKEEKEEKEENEQ